MQFIFSSLHCFEGPEWLQLKRGRESFARGPLVKVDPQGRCGGVLVYDLQMIILKTVQVSFFNCSHFWLICTIWNNVAHIFFLNFSYLETQIWICRTNQKLFLNLKVVPCKFYFCLVSNKFLMEGITDILCFFWLIANSDYIWHNLGSSAGRSCCLIFILFSLWSSNIPCFY